MTFESRASGVAVVSATSVPVHVVAEGEHDLEQRAQAARARHVARRAQHGGCTRRGLGRRHREFLLEQQRAHALRVVRDPATHQPTQAGFEPRDIFRTKVLPPRPKRGGQYYSLLIIIIYSLTTCVCS